MFTPSCAKTRRKGSRDLFFISRPACAALALYRPQPKEPAPSWGIHDPGFGRAIIGRRGENVAPVHHRDAVGVFLQREIRRGRRPVYSRGICRRARDGQQRPAGRLHGGDDSPESTVNDETAPGYRPAGILLADGPTDGINTPGPRAVDARRSDCERVASRRNRDV